MFFSPVTIRPHPKAPPRKLMGKRRRRTTAILTDTPTHNSLQFEKENIGKKCKRKLDTSDKSKKKVNSKKRDEEEREKEVSCIVCQETYSRSREVWVSLSCVLPLLGP
jgi:hypothetical protein